MRIALGEILNESGKAHSHCWVMYKSESGIWINLDSLLYKQKLKNKVKSRNFIKPNNKFEYKPFFVFNNKHLWGIKQNEKKLSAYLSSRTFWEEYNPAFILEIHANISEFALSDIFNIWERFEIRRGDLTSDSPDIFRDYHPFDHMDNGYIREGWNRVYQRLQSNNLLELGCALHGSC